MYLKDSKTHSNMTSYVQLYYLFFWSIQGGSFSWHGFRLRLRLWKFIMWWHIPVVGCLIWPSSSRKISSFSKPSSSRKPSPSCSLSYLTTESCKNFLRSGNFFGSKNTGIPFFQPPEYLITYQLQKKLLLRHLLCLPCHRQYIYIYILV